MQIRKAGTLGLLATVLIVSGALAGNEDVKFPTGYDTVFVRYVTIDKPERTPPIIRFMYVNPEALAAARADAPLPHGTVIIMEDHKALLDDGGAPVSAAGRFVATAEITNVFVQEKQPGWGADYPADKRNGEWEYAWFNADGTRKVSDPARFDGCFACHKDNAAAQDYNFTLAPFIADLKR